MEKKVKFTIEVDTRTKELKVLNNDFEVLTRKVHNVSASLKDFGSVSNSIFNALLKYDIARNAIIGAVYALSDLTRAGIEYNASLESMRTGIASLIAAQKRAAGEHIAFRDALKQSGSVMELLKKANLETSATLKQLTQGFQAALAPAMQAGLTIKQTVEYTKLMTQAAGAMGVPMDQLAQELKSVVSGTIDLNSVVATNLGITNEQIRLHKRQGDLFEFLKGKLAAFAEAGEAVQNSFNGVVSNLEDSWSEFLGLLSQPAFDAIKEGLKSLNSIVKEWTQTVKKARIEEKKWFATANIEEVKIKAQAIGKQIEELKQKLDGFWSFLLSDTERSAIEARIKKLNQELYLLGKHAAELAEDSQALETNSAAKAKNSAKTQEEIKALAKLNEEFRKKFAFISDDPYEKLVHQYQEYLRRYKSITGSKQKIDEWYYKELEKLNKEVLQRFENEERDRLARREAAYAAYLESIGKKEELFWFKEGRKLNQLLLDGLKQDEALQMLQKDLERFKEKMEDGAKQSVDLWSDASSAMAETIERNFFDFVTGRFNSLKDFLRNLLNDIVSNLFTPFSKQLSALLSGAMPAIASDISLQDAASALVQSGFKALGDGVYMNEAGQKVVLSSSGVEAYGSGGEQIDLGSVAGLPTQVGKVASFLQNPQAFLQSLQLGIMRPFANIGTTLSSAGLVNAGSAVTSFGVGLANPLSVLETVASQGGWGSLAGFSAGVGGMLAAGGIGYGMGSIGDMIFGKETKAALYGAIGAAIGSIIPGIGTLIGGAIGSLLGGIVGGKWRMEDFGVGVVSPVSAEDLSGLMDWEFWRKDRWIGGDKKSDKLKDVDDYTRSQIEGLLRSFESIVDMLNGTYDQIDIILQKGRYSSRDKTFTEYVTKKLLSQLLGYQETIDKISKAFEEHGYRYEGGWDAEGLILVEKFYKGRIHKIDDMIKKGFISAADKAKLEHLEDVYSAWEKYAKSVDKEVIEVVQEAFSKVQKSFDSFRAFNLSKIGLDGTSIVETQRSIEALHISFDSVRDDLQKAGFDIKSVGEITTQNFEEIYKSVLKNNPTPQTIESFTALGEAILSVAQKAASVTQKLDAYFGDDTNYAKERYDEINKLVERYFGAEFKTEDPQAILELIRNGSQEIKAAFSPYIDMLIAEAMKLKEKGRDYLAWLVEFNSQGTQTFEAIIENGRQRSELLRQRKEEADRALQDIRKKLGVADLDYQNFMDYYTAALEAHPSAEERAAWEEAKVAVMNAAQANRDYANSLHAVAQAAAQMKQNYWSVVDQQKDRFQALLDKIEQQQERSFGAAAKSFEKAATNAAKSFADALRSASSALDGMINRLSGDILGSRYSEAKFYSFLDLAKSALQNKDYTNYADYVKRMSSYIGFLDKKQYSSPYERAYEKAYILNQLKELKSPTEIMIEHLQKIAANTASTSGYSAQIADNTYGTQEGLYSLTTQMLGGQSFQEVLKDGVIQGVKGSGLTAVLGDNLPSILTQLEQTNYRWETVSFADGKLGVLVDFDKDGINDMVLSLNSSGVLQAIDTNTAQNYKTITKVFGDRSIEELLNKDMIESIFNSDFSIAIGDTLKIVQDTLNANNMLYNQIGDSLLVDVDKDGVFDFKLVFDATGHLQHIEENTAGLKEALLAAKKDNVITPKELENIIKLMKEDDYILAPGGVPISKQQAANWANNGYILNYSGSPLTQFDGEKYTNFQKRSIPTYFGDNPPPSLQKYFDAKKHKWFGFATGGYTGDGHWLEPAGIVHRGEFVVNAKTTRILGLNKDNGGVFLDMLAELRALRQEIDEMKRYQRDTAENTSILKTEARMGP